MIQHTPGTIYLADQREALITTLSRRFRTFGGSSGAAEAAKPPFGALCAFNEETLMPAQRVTIHAERAGYVVVVPVTGTLWVSGQIGTDDGLEIDLETVLLLPVAAQSTVTFANPYGTETLTFLHMWLKGRTVFGPVTPHRFPFSSAALNNQLHEIVPGVNKGQRWLPFSLRLGRFDGRQKTRCSLQNSDDHFFTYILAGTFEIDGRLLHEHDALALWGLEEVEIEALSHDALLLVMVVK